MPTFLPKSALVPAQAGLSWLYVQLILPATHPPGQIWILSFVQCLENNSCQSIGINPQNVFEPHPDHKSNSIRSKKDQNDPKLRQIQNHDIELFLENKSC